MYAFSIISGRLADRWGRGPVIMIGSVTLVIACIAATISPDVLPLGVGIIFAWLWMEFLLCGRLHFACRSTFPLERARTQGFNDLLVGLASALGSLESGFIFAALGYNMMAYISAAFAVIPLLFASFWTLKFARKTQASC